MRPLVGARVIAKRLIFGDLGNREAIPAGTQGYVKEHIGGWDSEDFRVRYDNGVERNHSARWQGESWELVEGADSCPPIGTQIRCLSAQKNIPKGEIGVVKDLPNSAGVRVQYPNREYTHDLSNKNITWEVFPDPVYKIVAPSHLIIQDKGDMELYITNSVEVIDGVVGQVKYGETIVWQSEPVATSDDDGPISLDKQHVNAQQVARDKVRDVVKAQFAS